jgi:hypothetical protein
MVKIIILADDGDFIESGAAENDVDDDIKQGQLHWHLGC